MLKKKKKSTFRELVVDYGGRVVVPLAGWFGCKFCVFVACVDALLPFTSKGVDKLTCTR